MKKIIINGANGYVASNFINTLLNNNYEVIALVRGSKKYSAEERMLRALSDVSDGTSIKNNRLKVYAYALTEENFSLSDEELLTIFSGDFDYYHFAASLKYDLKSRDEIFGTNIKGIHNSLDVYSKYANSSSRFFFISTAYSCGHFKGLFEEKFYENEDIDCFRNYYEQSKRFAENVIKSHIEDHGTKAYVIRLSQVVGDSTNGVTKTDYGIFDFAKRMYSLANRYPNNTVRIKVDPEATQNLIPVNIVVSYLMRTVESKNVPGILNVIAKQATTNHHIIESVTKLMPLNIVPVSEINKEEMSSLERLVSVGMSFTGSYIKTNLRFDTNNLDSLAPDISQEPVEQAVCNMLAYFVANLPAPKGAVVLSETGESMC